MRVFISYAAKDSKLASRLADQLSVAGFTVWYADEEIAPGDNWAKKIGQALDESDLMVVLVTRGSLESESLQRDIEYALTSKNYAHRLVPVLVGYVTFEAGKDVPWILLKMNPVYIEPDATGGFSQVVQRIRDIAQQETNAAR
jgi:hypothetical protein